jgi:hypothetical protein
VLETHNKESAEFKAFLEQRMQDARDGKLVYNDTQAEVKNGKKSAGDTMDEKDATRGAHIAFVSYWKASHVDEHAAFKSEWEAANPKEARAASGGSDPSIPSMLSVLRGRGIAVNELTNAFLLRAVTPGGSSVASDSESTAEGPEKVAKKRGAKKDSERSAEDLAAVKAKRAAKKAEKAAKKAESEVEGRSALNMEPAAPAAPAAPVIPSGGGGEETQEQAAEESSQEAEAEEVEMSHKPFTHSKVKYLRLGYLDEEQGKMVWDEDGDLWLAQKDGSLGAYAGVLKSDGTIDNSPETLANEPVCQ